MSAKTFLIAHGEKFVLTAVAGGCALVLWGTIDDPTIRPKQDQQQIEAINAKIDAVFKKQSPPVMKEPRPYLDQLLARVGESAPMTPTMAWLTNPPDKGRIVGGEGLYLYVYQVLPPTVSIADAIGSLNITVAAPDSSTEGAGRRISSEPERRWRREDKGTVENTGRELGLQVEIKIGDNEWKPLALPGASTDGVLPLAAIPATALTIPTPEPWQKHKLRARVIAAATALDLDANLPERPKQSVLVYPGHASAGPTEDQTVLDKALTQVKAKSGAFYKALLRPVSGPLPADSKLEPGEKLFLGPWCTPAETETTASVRFALVGLSTASLPEDPTKFHDVGRFLLLRLFEQDGDRKWMEKPLEERFGVGDVLGLKEVVIPNPFQTDTKIKVNLDTPFVVDKLIKDQKRVLYWMVKPVSRKGGGRARDLALDSKEVKTDIVVLKNPETGSELTLTKLINIIPPTSRPDLLIYPHRMAAYIEKDEFTKAPSEFRQWGLIPETPKAYAPGTGPLEELHKQKIDEGALDKASYVTDTPYYVFPDGRIAWWELVENSLKVFDPEDVMAAKDVAPAAITPEAQPPAPNTPHGRKTGAHGGEPEPMQPGVPPPGMQPPGMPPGMPPRR